MAVQTTPITGESGASDSLLASSISGDVDFEIRTPGGKGGLVRDAYAYASGGGGGGCCITGTIPADQIAAVGNGSIQVTWDANGGSFGAVLVTLAGDQFTYALNAEYGHDAPSPGGPDNGYGGDPANIAYDDASWASALFPGGTGGVSDDIDGGGGAAGGAIGITNGVFNDGVAGDSSGSGGNGGAGQDDLAGNGGQGGVAAGSSAPGDGSPMGGGGGGHFNSEGSGGAGGDGQVVLTYTPATLPVITSNGGGPTAAVSVLEGNTSVTTVQGTGSNGMVYSVDGGDDGGTFVIDSATGELSFLVPPDFEMPTDSGADNVYNVTVAATNDVGATFQAIAVTVTNDSGDDGGGSMPPCNNRLDLGAGPLSV